MRGLRESVEKQDEEKKKGRKKQKNERGGERKVIFLGWVKEL